jgi:hypothetical protein
VQHLIEYKRAARAHRACDRLAQAAPAAANLLERAGARGDNLRSITAALLIPRRYCWRPPPPQSRKA